MTEKRVRWFPWATLALGLLHFFVYSWQMQSPTVDVFYRLLEDYGFSWARFVKDPLQEAPTLLSAVFMHGGSEHFKGNMLFFFLFSPFVEKAFGAVSFFISYLVWGVTASLIQGFFH